MKVTIRPFTFQDFPAWLALWQENNQGQTDEAITAQTWQRLFDQNANVHGLGAFNGSQLTGFLHYVTHPTTGALNDACYMQDLFVVPAHRGKGIARKLLQELAAEHSRQKWARIYWVAEKNNQRAQKLYESFGKRLEFSFHVMI